MATLLTAEEVSAALGGLPGWSGGTDGIARTIETASFPAAIALVNAVAGAAEAADHHPDIDVRWRTVTFALSTHSEGGVTSKDIAMAAKINDLFEGTPR
jgi:4a-hydroxytetrahydrobiopterin dehydratase